MKEFNFLFIIFNSNKYYDVFNLLKDTISITRRTNILDTYVLDLILKYHKKYMPRTYFLV